VLSQQIRSATPGRGLWPRDHMRTGDGVTQHESPSRSPYVSVVVAVFNGVDTLQRALDSLFAQTYRDWELVVIDGGSTDGSVAILERASDRISYWVSEPDRGIYDAWNKALSRLRGQWVVFLGADDYLADRSVLARANGAPPSDGGGKNPGRLRADRARGLA
jgi:glycosyltransferase involved in cell wall biosynthesis